MKSKIALPLLLSAMLLAGCLATSDVLNRLQIGMTRDQVVALLGQPNSTSAPAPNVQYLTYYLTVTTDRGYERDQPYVIRIVDGKVESYGRFSQLNDYYLRPVNGQPSPINGMVVAPGAMTTQGGPDLATEITRLKALKDQGILSDDEFQKAKAKLLGGP